MKKSVKKPKKIEEMFEEMAEMIQRGFSEAYYNFKEEIKEVREDIKSTEKRLTDKIDGIKFIFGSHDRRIDILEDNVRVINTKVGIK